MADEANDLESLLSAHASAAMPPLVVPGAWDALSAQAIERAGYKAAFVGRNAICRSLLGSDEIDLVTVRMMVVAVANLRDSCGLSLIVDAGNGFGNAFNVARTVTTLEGAGAGAVQIDDDIGVQGAAAAGKLTVDMIGKVKAAVDAAKDVLLIARTVLAGGEGVSAAADRAHAYMEAGADMVMIGRDAALRDVIDLAETVRGKVPLALESDAATIDGLPKVAMICQPMRLQRDLFANVSALLAPATLAAYDPEFAAIRSLAS